MAAQTPATITDVRDAPLLEEDDCDPESEPEFGLEVGAGVAGCVTCSKESSVLDIGQRSLFCGGRYKKRTYI